MKLLKILFLVLFLSPPSAANLRREQKPDCMRNGNRSACQEFRKDPPIFNDLPSVGPISIQVIPYRGPSLVRSSKYQDSVLSPSNPVKRTIRRKRRNTRNSVRHNKININTYPWGLDLQEY